MSNSNTSLAYQVAPVVFFFFFFLKDLLRACEVLHCNAKLPYFTEVTIIHFRENPLPPQKVRKPFHFSGESHFQGYRNGTLG